MNIRFFIQPKFFLSELTVLGLLLVDLSCIYLHSFICLFREKRANLQKKNHLPQMNDQMG
jgi:hypothetical protein